MAGQAENALLCICTIMHADAFQTLADPTRRRIVEARLDKLGQELDRRQKARAATRKEERS